MKRCPDSRCNAPDVACRLGEATPADCAVWGNSADTEAPEGDSPNLTLLPWSGAALGTTDLAFLTSRGDPKLVALIGPHNAGKTTLLAAFYQQIGRTGSIGEVRFAGSYSLEGWEAIAHALRWEGGTPKFPPHTPSGTGRAPGLLHLAQRAADGNLSDFLFADTPGEWFQRWTMDVDAPDAEGARWLADRASTLAIVADCEALSGAKRGEARNEMVSLIRRVASERRGRPVALIWTKADIQVSQPIRDAVRNAAKRGMPDIVEFETSVVPRSLDDIAIEPIAAVKMVLAWATTPLPVGFSPPAYRSGTRDPFFSIGADA